MAGKWNESMSYQPCDSESEPLPGTKLKEYGRKVETTRETVIPEPDCRVPIVSVQFIPNHGFKYFQLTFPKLCASELFGFHFLLINGQAQISKLHAFGFWLLKNQFMFRIAFQIPSYKRFKA